GCVGRAPTAACWPMPSTKPVRTPEIGARGTGGAAGVATIVGVGAGVVVETCGGVDRAGVGARRGAAPRRTHASISRRTAGPAPRASKSARSRALGVKLRQL